jgi:signal transduction histidine kinase
VTRIGVAAATFAVYLPAYLLLESRMKGAGALVTVPVIAAAWLLGSRGGLVASLLAIALNAALYGGPANLMRSGGVPGMLALVPIGLVVGRLRELNLQVKTQLAERDRIHAELADSERKRLEAEAAVNLARASQMGAVGSLASSLAHEINNPLAFVMSNLAFVRDQLGSNRPEQLAESHDALAEALEGLLRIQAVVAGIRDVSLDRGEGGQAVDACAVLDSAIKVVRAGSAKRARVEVEHRHPERARSFVRASHGRLAQAFLNLLTNAVEALPAEDPARQRVRVTCQVRDARVTIEISDSGRGIPQEMAARLFQPFFTTKPAGTGAGLGLYVSRNILNAAGGELTYTTEVGVGSTFRVELPSLETA